MLSLTNTVIKANKRLFAAHYTLIIIILFAALISALYWTTNREHKVLNEEAREQIGGSYVLISQGTTHYELSGNPRSRQNSQNTQNTQNSETVVLVHGFSSPMYVFDPTFNALTQSGFTTLRYDLFGRGFSDRPNSEYGMDLYVRQLNELLNKLEINEPVHLIGLSMGGAIATHFANKHPNAVASLNLIAPLVQTPERPEMALVKAPLLGEYLGKVLIVPKFINGIAQTVHNPNTFPDWKRKFQPQTEYYGYAKALVESIRYLAGKSFEEEYKLLGKSDIPIQLIWGTEDRIIPVDHSALIKENILNITFKKINEAGHLPHYEKPAEVNKHIIEFITRQ